jgi:hypothetical protein
MIEAKYNMIKLKSGGHISLVDSTRPGESQRAMETAQHWKCKNLLHLTVG